MRLGFMSWKPLQYEKDFARRNMEKMAGAATGEDLPIVSCLLLIAYCLLLIVYCSLQIAL